MQSNESGLPEEFIAEEMVVSALDEECHAFSLELQKPVTIQDPLFGDLVLDRSLNWFTGKAIWEEVIVPITFSVEGPMEYGLEAASLEPLVTIGRDLLTHQTEWLANIKSCIFGEIFSYINEMLVQLGESPISLADFQNRLSLKSIIVHKPDLVGFNFEFGNTWLFGFDIGISLSEGIYDWKIHM